MTPAQGWVLFSIALVLAALACAWPYFVEILSVAILGLWFVANALFRAWLVLMGSRAIGMGETPRKQDRDDLPLYSILVPLYREANVVPRLIRALVALDYPGIR
ncbi:MAG TPA: hypothetical protein VGG36_07360 [Rhizomicrobium sp.]